MREHPRGMDDNPKEEVDVTETSEPAGKVLFRGQYIGETALFATGVLGALLPSTGREAVYLIDEKGGGHPVWVDTLRGVGVEVPRG